MEEQRRQSERGAPARESQPGAGHTGSGGIESPGEIDLHCLEFCPICRTADVLRTTLPNDFHEQMHSLQRDVLVAVRSALNHYIEHMDSERERTKAVEDIPVE